MKSIASVLTPGKKGGFGSKPVGRTAAAKKPADAKPSPESLAAQERDAAKERRAKAEKKERDEVNQLKERLSKGHRLNDDELAQLEMAAVARWNQLQREDEERHLTVKADDLRLPVGHTLATIRSSHAAADDADAADDAIVAIDAAINAAGVDVGVVIPGLVLAAGPVCRRLPARWPPGSAQFTQRHARTSS